MSVITRKLTLMPQGDKEEINRVYTYIRNGMKVQSLMMNKCISALYMAKINKMPLDEYKELKKSYSRIPTSEKGSAYDFDMEIYPTGLPLAGSIPRVCEQKLQKAIKDGLLYGKVSLPTYKATMPMRVHNKWINVMESNSRANGFYHDYDTPMDFIDALYNERSPKIHIKFANGIVFNVILGNPYRSNELRNVLERIFSGEYKVCDSTIGIDKRTNKKIELNLSIQIPDKENKLDENTVVGVDIGFSSPAVCSLNNSMFTREFIGDNEDFIRKRTQLQEQRRQIVKHLKTSNGGHGRKDKLKHLEKIDIHEREFAKTYNHMVSSRIIKFALKNNAKYINMLNLSNMNKSEKSQFVLRNWSYYELQTMVLYKAKKEGIEVRFVNPKDIDKKCSVCGEIGTIVSADEFICTNPTCKCHSKYKKHLITGFNTSRNIALCEDFITEKEKKETVIKKKND